MNPMEHHPSQFHRAPPTETVCTETKTVERREISGQAADCCSARPLFRVILPVTAERSRPVELFLCGHHRQHCRRGLAAAHASTFDAAGHLVGND